MDYDEKMHNRMKRIEGQVRGIIRMMENEKDCRDVVSQISAVRTALDKAAAVMVSTNLERCLREQLAKGEDTQQTIDEAVHLLVKSH